MGGGDCILSLVSKPKLQTPGSVLLQLSLIALVGLQPPVFKVSKDSLLLFSGAVPQQA